MKAGNLSPTPMFAIHCSFQYSEGTLKTPTFSEPLNRNPYTSWAFSYRSFSPIGPSVCL
jgi:hypothetical protein